MAVCKLVVYQALRHISNLGIFPFILTNIPCNTLVLAIYNPTLQAFNTKTSASDL